MRQFKLDAARNHLMYSGRPLSITFYPFILSESQSDHIAGVVEAMTRLAEKMTRLFFEERGIREVFGFGPEQTELIEVDPGYEPAIPCARFDSFFDGRTLRFTELNTDGTAGMDGADKLAKLFVSAPTMRDFFSRRSIRVFDINRCVLQTLLECHKQFVGGTPAETPRIAIADWKEARTHEEFVAFEEFCRERGHEAVVVDPREFDYNGRVLSHRGLRIDIIYRRAVSSEYVERLEEVTAMTRAFMDHNVCVVGSFRSDVAFNKKIFGVLHDPRFARFLTHEERALVEEHVPWTHPFENNDCEFRGHRVNMLELARDKKDALVLKPPNLYEGLGVTLGSHVTRDEWENAVGSALESDYVIQELIPIPSMPVGVWNDGFEKETRMIHLGEYVFGGRFCGFYCRASDGPIINRTSKELLVPCLVLEQ